MSFAMFDSLIRMLEAENDPRFAQVQKEIRNPDGSENYESLYFTMIQSLINFSNVWTDLSEKNFKGQITNEQVIDKMTDYVSGNLPSLAILEEHMKAKKENRPADMKAALTKLFGF